MTIVCQSCGKTLVRDEISATRKLINRGADRFFCAACLAEYFAVSEDIILDKIRYFKETGCTLFDT